MAYLTGAGTLMRVDISSTMTTIPQVKDVTPPIMELGAVETTHLTSAARERMPTIHDGGTVQFNLEYDPANSVHAQLDTYYRAKTVVTWNIKLADAGECLIAFSGFITKFGIGQLGVEDVVMIPCEIQVTGLPTVTP